MSNINVRDLEETIRGVLEEQTPFLPAGEREKLASALAIKIIGKFYLVLYNR